MSNSQALVKLECVGNISPHIQLRAHRASLLASSAQNFRRAVNSLPYVHGLSSWRLDQAIGIFATYLNDKHEIQIATMSMEQAVTVQSTPCWYVMQSSRIGAAHLQNFPCPHRLYAVLYPNERQRT
jgi:hypothetical protein